MKKRLTPMLFMLLLVIFLLWMAGVFYGDEVAERKTSGIHFSVVMYGSENNDRWKFLDQGIRQACRELEIENPITSVSPMHNMAEQVNLLEREINAGARGLLVAAEDSDAMEIALDGIPPAVPVVFFKTGARGLPYVAADDAAMAKMLAEKLAGHETIALLTGNLQRENVRVRQDAFLQALHDMGIQPLLLDAFPSSQSSAANDYDTLVALDTQTLEHAIDMQAEMGTRFAIYGIGSSDRVVHALNQSMLRGVVFQNEYAIGYIATMLLAAEIGLIKKAPQAPIQYMYVDASNMYLPEVERLLFPIVQ